MKFSLFGKTPSPEEQVKKWCRDLRAEARRVDREIAKFEREQAKVKIDIKKYAAKGEISSAKILAKSIAKTNKTIERMHVSKTQLNSAAMKLKEQQSTLKVVGAMQLSSEVMQSMQRLMSLPRAQTVAKLMVMEMEKAGMVSDMVDETFEMIEDEDIEEEAEAEINKVLYDVTKGQLGSLEAAPVTQPVAEEAPAETDAELDQMQARLQQLSKG